MPTFLGQLEDSHTSNRAYNQNVGPQFRLVIGDPRNPVSGRSLDAFFYPDPSSTVTYMGPKMWEWCKCENMAMTEKVYLSLRCLFATTSHQIKIVIPRSDIRLTDELDPEHLSLGASAVLNGLETTNWSRPWKLSGTSPTGRPRLLSLTCKRFLSSQPTTNCY